MPKMPFSPAADEQRLEVRHRLHQLHAVLFFQQALVDLQEGDNAALFPEEGWNRLAVDIAIHGAFKEDGADYLVAGKGGGLHDAHAHAWIRRYISSSPDSRSRRRRRDAVHPGVEPPLWSSAAMKPGAEVILSNIFASTIFHSYP